MFRSHRSGQSAFEFLFLLLFVLFVASLVVVLLEQNLEREIDRLDQQIVSEYRDIWFEELTLASTAESGYDRVFDVTGNPRGFPISSRFGADSGNVTDEVVIDYKDEETLYFLPTEVNYSGLGQNVSLNDGVRVSRRCYDECGVYLYAKNYSAPGLSGANQKTVDTGIATGSDTTVEGRWPWLAVGGTNRVVVYNRSQGLLSTVHNFSAATTAMTVSEDELIARTSSEMASFNLSDGSRNNFFGTPATPVEDDPFLYAAESQVTSFYAENNSYTSIGSGASVTDATASAYEDHGYVLTSKDGSVEIVNVTNRAAPSTVATITSDISDDAVALWVDGHDVLRVSETGISTYSLAADHTGLTEQDSVSFGGSSASGASLWRDTIAVALGNDGYAVYSVGDVSAIDQRATVASPTAYAVHMSHDKLYTVDGAGRVQAWR